MRGQLEEQAAALRIESQVRFLGHRDDLYDVISIFDLFVLTSAHEGIPMVLLEAMALGVRVVAPAVGGIPEIADTHQAVLVDAPTPERFSQLISTEIHSMRLRDTRERTNSPHVVSAYETARETARIYESLITA